MPAAPRRWTLDDLDRLPDDGNKYEVVRGRLFVTPAPAPRHEVVLARLARILEPYVDARKLGQVYRPRAVIRFEDSEVEPDLMVRAEPPAIDTPWEAWPIPLLVVEVLSAATRSRDLIDKRDFYADAGVAECWVIDTEARRIRVMAGRSDVAIISDEMRWQPAGAPDPLRFAVAPLFD
jgi:Uma2 family endonuclease